MKWVSAAAMLTMCLAGCDTGIDTAPTEAAITVPAPDYTASQTLQNTLPELSEALASGTLTSVDLTQAYLDRIAAIDRAGPKLNAILSLNPDALEQAAQSDARRQAGEILGPLDGLPILLKDNIESLDPIPTTAGSVALQNNLTGRDSPLVAGLRAEGAVILGKTNLSQWANFRSEQSNSGWSSLGGQVRNPHILDRNPCGSSSGSGAATAASLAAGSVGTETNGSIICPSNVNGIVGFKPTVGLVSAAHIIPISPSQDTAGPMTKSVRGAAMMLSAMADGGGDFSADLSPDSLVGARVGVLRFAQGSNPRIHAAFDRALSDLEAAGAILVEIDAFTPNADNFWGSAFTVLKYEFKASLNAYLASLPDQVETRSLADLIAFNEANAETELALFGQDIFIASEALGALSDAAYIEARDAVQNATRADGIDTLIAENDVVVLVAPSGPLSPPIDLINGDVWPDWAGAGALAAIAGYPHLTVPMADIRGVPVGLSFIGGANTDAAILNFGYAYEQQSQRRVDPQYWPTATAQTEISKQADPHTETD